MPALAPADWWTIAVAASCGVACGTPGVYLVLRRLSMLGDAISHAILPGLVIAFLLTGSRGVLPMLVGALVAGLATAAISSGVARLGRVPEDAALGVVFTSLFALGVLLLSLFARNVDLDAGCVLYGLIDAAALDTRPIFGMHVPRSLLVLAPCALINVTLLGLFSKELALSSFDPELATAMGFRAGIIHHALLAMIAATCVAAFEAVGSILVVAMLIVPGATASLLTTRLSRMLWIAAAVAVIGAVGGYLLAVRLNTSVAGAISIALGAQFTLALFGSPTQGLIPQAWRRAALTLRIRQEDLLADLYRTHEGSAPHDVRPPNPVAVVLLNLRGLVSAGATGPALTPRGLAYARAIIRGHRLWESFLAENLRLPTDHLHDPAHRIEHFIDAALRDELARTQSSDTDPQGKNIPR
ncbi:MAG: manganese ABC transporter permease [Phycisphaerae bacterium]|nr:MAG: manganese ABC transporter permease [Phycisphaerae bacterium]